MRETPLTPWVICEKSGKILAAHCNCMAGQDESCSHVASVLWAVEAGAKRRDSLTVTDKKAYWVMPTPMKSVPYARIKDIDFFKSKTPNDNTASMVPPSPAKFNTFLESLKKCPSKPAALSLIPKFSDDYMPRSAQSDLPPILIDLYDKTLSDSNLTEILNNIIPKSSKFCTITAEQQHAVERETRGQSQSRLWYRMRTGRITASKYKAVCHTNAQNPAHSLVMEICYPETKRFRTEATDWGNRKEARARQDYVAQAKQLHKDFQLEECGLVISKTNAYIGASPDGLISCTCCGLGVCEIKVTQCHWTD